MGITKVLNMYHDSWPAEFEKNYPLQPQILPEGFVHGDVSRMRGVLRKLMNGELIVVMVIGGSFTKGDGCHDLLNRQERSCNWNSRVARWFQQAFPKARFSWHDESQGATPGLQFLTGMGAMMRSYEALPDLVIIDTHLNDAAWPVHEIEGDAKKASIPEAKGAGFEKLVMVMQEIAPDAQLLLVQDGCVPHCLNSHDQKVVAVHRKIPIVDYATLVAKYNFAVPGEYAGSVQSGGQKQQSTAQEYQNAPARLWVVETWKPGTYYKGIVWPRFAPRTTQLARVFYPLNHPPWPVHQYVADLTVYSILQMLEDACEENEWTRVAPVAKSAWPKASLDKFPACQLPLSFYSALRAFKGDPSRHSLKPAVIKGNWALMEDRPGKPGWIGSEPLSVLRFEFQLAPRAGGALSISYLSSYQGVGYALAKVHKKDTPADVRTVKLYGKAEKYSQVKTDFFSMFKGILIKKEWLFSDKQTDFALVIEIPRDMPAGTKFKIVQVTSC
eukprot:TRINITY_DN19100_c0_g1_i2.p1 TRINITY_DN19100_c0_g1~~TRINITY_DN19100_c0_g1_i2.p1  ORF type:complete len:499 (-),score=57.45 TRINITY_DN19100_c0_g1_i2:18-1514(-)